MKVLEPIRGPGTSSVVTNQHPAIAVIGKVPFTQLGRELLDVHCNGTSKSNLSLEIFMMPNTLSENRMKAVPITRSN